MATGKKFQLGKVLLERERLGVLLPSPYQRLIDRIGLVNGRIELRLCFLPMRHDQIIDGEPLKIRIQFRG